MKAFLKGKKLLLLSSLVLKHSRVNESTEVLLSNKCLISVRLTFARIALSDFFFSESSASIGDHPLYNINLHRFCSLRLQTCFQKGMRPIEVTLCSMRSQKYPLSFLSSMVKGLMHRLYYVIIATKA